MRPFGHWLARLVAQDGALLQALLSVGRSVPLVRSDVSDLMRRCLCASQPLARFFVDGGAMMRARDTRRDQGAPAVQKSRGDALGEVG